MASSLSFLCTFSSGKLRLTRVNDRFKSPACYALRASTLLRSGGGGVRGRSGGMQRERGTELLRAERLKRGGEVRRSSEEFKAEPLGFSFSMLSPSVPRLSCSLPPLKCRRLWGHAARPPPRQNDAFVFVFAQGGPELLGGLHIWSKSAKRRARRAEASGSPAPASAARHSLDIRRLQLLQRAADAHARGKEKRGVHWGFVGEDRSRGKKGRRFDEAGVSCRDGERRALEGLRETEVAMCTGGGGREEGGRGRPP